MRKLLLPAHGIKRSLKFIQLGCAGEGWSRIIEFVTSYVLKYSNCVVIDYSRRIGE